MQTIVNFSFKSCNKQTNKKLVYTTTKPHHNKINNEPTSKPKRRRLNKIKTK